MRKQLYKFLIILLESVTDTSDNKIKLVKHIDLWNQNVEFAEVGEIFNTPAVFIEFSDIKYETYRGTATRQYGDVNVSIHIVTRSLSSTSNFSNSQDAALNFLELIDRIHNTLDGKSAPGIGALRRIMSVTNHNHGELLESIETYTTTVKDASALP